ncbi:MULTISPECIES: DUF3850 domain-containing protein [Serratia]|uniref:DUF3850 domain-containing protein n=2 Tax=Serratia ureilytica TaxID=300181 RepID=A0ABU0VK00_9GAMM|nr:DUF3850 domain-containing protein [Serratia ureilytica]MDQ1839510.1 DUF3850 domain-containing protein [Serratia ureilytica]MDQ1861749.1 DUF3850 domain-containing protein [Serratia ureilytica]
MRMHDLKIRPEHFAAVVNDQKKAEFRLNDRGYSVGDLLCLHEFGQHPEFDHLEGFLGNHVWARITHITHLEEWLSGYVMLSIEREPFSC